MDKRRARNFAVIYAIIFIVGVLLIYRWMQDGSNLTTSYSYVDLQTDLSENNVMSLDIYQNSEIPTGSVSVVFKNGTGVEFQSNPEIAGSPRNSFRASVMLDYRR